MGKIKQTAWLVLPLAALAAVLWWYIAPLAAMLAVK